jgi:hypothetical protein
MGTFVLFGHIQHRVIHGGGGIDGIDTIQQVMQLRIQLLHLTELICARHCEL